MNRSNLLASRIKDRIKPQEASDQLFWDDFSRRIRDCRVIPVVGNALRYEAIFSPESPGSAPASAEPVSGSSSEGESAPPPDGMTQGDSAAPGDAALQDAAPADATIRTVDEQLSEIWAEEIGYPLSDRYDLASVAQFNRVQSADAEQAKARYLSFLKNSLLQWAEGDPATSEIAAELRSQVNEVGFADITPDLDYPRFTDPSQDPLRILARLPLSIYITTSPFDFLERAIQAEHRTPITQVCFWSGEEPNSLLEHHADPSFIPSAETPVVYHLHGLERYPRTLVVSEDDYMDFLSAVLQDTDTLHPIIPLYIRGAVAESSLMLLGFRLQDWDFRVLFRGLVSRSLNNSQRRINLIIQLMPDSQGGISNPDKAREYLKEYFRPSQFRVEWSQADRFLLKLWEDWKRWRQGQA